MNAEDELKRILGKSEVIRKTLEQAPLLGAPHWYIGAGIIAQTVWNHTHGFPLTTGIKDIDFVYFDPDTSYEAEDAFIKKGDGIFRNITIPVEIYNQARVHLWYQEHFGYVIPAHHSTEAAIDTWPTTATAVGVTLDDHQNIKIYAPFGLDDLLGLIVRPNKPTITEKVYLDKVNRWKAIWPDLKIVSWGNL
jgi:hypothetical protein